MTGKNNFENSMRGASSFPVFSMLLGHFLCLAFARFFFIVL